MGVSRVSPRVTPDQFFAIWLNEHRFTAVTFTTVVIGLETATRASRLQ